MSYGVERWTLGLRVPFIKHVMTFFLWLTHLESRNHCIHALARFQAKLVLGQAAANVKIRGRILFAVRGREMILLCT